MKLNPILRAMEWFSATPERSLDRSYRAALSIQQIEKEHFNGKKVSRETSDYGNNVISYFQEEVKRYLETVKIGLAEFKTSRSLLLFSEFNSQKLDPTDSQNTLKTNPNAIILAKLKFIDETINRYSQKNITSQEEIIVIQTKESTVNGKIDKPQRNLVKELEKEQKNSPKLTSVNGETVKTVSDQTGVLPRSFLRTINRIKQEIDPKSQETEEEVLRKHRVSKYKTAISIKFILILIIVPLLTHQVTKTFLVAPIVERYFANHEQILFINNDLEEEAYFELKHYEERLHFQNLIGREQKKSAAEIEERLKEKADEIAEAYRHLGSDAIANIFADIFSLIAFAIIIWVSKKEILILKSFLDEIMYGLSDSAKAFLIILLTDVFVGYHSPHGWEVILEGITRHFGLPENREFNFLFIATFPVILDTILKYWIFRYLNRISPSSVATYRSMNE
ncbi:MAG: proton extrusion protein PcxA [Gomphosphaeria aponina SAG 52.96 = DSM 107014]|uniref:Proton extrusion protein PxcA n=1 Tax=Gomphosphaeria aponina SAG 52.96 = DSM 107014 TaxID=1521640 RepID=A0A941GVG5_9CHRO|nr:proton extrusion protein PcxA [Gomphosphaeria aponina SAG 52.96 = DSM 107014]